MKNENEKVEDLLLGDVIGFNGEPVAIVVGLEFVTDNFSTIKISEQQIINSTIRHRTIERSAEMQVFGKYSSKYIGNGTWKRVDGIKNV